MAWGLWFPAFSVNGLPQATGDDACPYRLMNHGEVTCITHDEYVRYSGYDRALGYAAAAFFLAFGSASVAGGRPERPDLSELTTRRRAAEREM